MPRRRLASLLALVVIVAACPAAPPSESGFTAADSTEVTAVRERYVRAWLGDDTAGVLALFERDGLILPPGKRALVGQQAMRDHWWPRDGSTTKLLTFRWTTDELDGDGSLAVMRGESTVTWEYTKDSRTSRDSSVSVNVTVFRRDPDGRWRIAWQTWGPGLK